MKAHPTSRYVTASAETWSLIRGAYLSGLSAPTVAARFGISVTALRKRAGREGWTKRRFADAASDPQPAHNASSPPPTGHAGSRPPTETEVVEACFEPMHIAPTDLARRALANAAHALKAGEGLQAVRLARAAGEIARLNDVLDWAHEDVIDTEARFEASQVMMRQYLRAEALRLAEALFAGLPLPETYEDLKQELGRLEGLRCGAGAGSGVSG